MSGQKQETLRMLQLYHQKLTVTQVCGSNAYSKGAIYFTISFTTDAEILFKNNPGLVGLPGTWQK